MSGDPGASVIASWNGAGVSSRQARRGDSSLCWFYIAVSTDHGARWMGLGPRRWSRDPDTGDGPKMRRGRDRHGCGVRYVAITVPNTGMPSLGGCLGNPIVGRQSPTDALDYPDSCPRGWRGPTPVDASRHQSFGRQGDTTSGSVACCDGRLGRAPVARGHAEGWGSGVTCMVHVSIRCIGLRRWTRCPATARCHGQPTHRPGNIFSGVWFCPSHARAIIYSGKLHRRGIPRD